MIAHLACPMLATAAKEPFHRAGWVYEEKYDGWRMLVYKADRSVRLLSRTGRDHTDRFPLLVTAIAELKTATLVLDGEVCIFDDRLISRLEWLRHSKPPGVATPPVFMAFDCLYADGRDLRPMKLQKRRDSLEAVILGQDLLLPARRLAAHGLAAWSEVLERGCEGLVAKDEASPYQEGRTLSWRKIKQRQYREEERGWKPKGK